ncbi:purine-binding chemotaxis protein CheW [Halobacillus karajensis]|uniref:Chemotaxis protein CheW n=1 Tax=Halobacillus karajensis TaxID=195088 RepID=A0A024P3H4_9BACI|nr:chemotaxis protein CheW [Halobacillus karajensis]CDQ22182.1 Chemotaxis protein CheW [Halobacillus karajensis]CDQ28023.1 Chemotaxis protein CheW [Halobacillus karajensis]SEH73262.1 purine-binding chemotaxis protein CheW [Halobacillus karajensis]
MTEETTQRKVIVFQIHEEEYTIPVELVGSIERMMPITRVPGTKPFVKGVLNLRGVVTPVIDLRERFGMDKIEETERTRIVTVKIKERNVGLIVDAAKDVLDLDEENIEPPPEVTGTVEADYIQGVSKMDQRLFILLNLEKVLSKEDVLELNQIHA